MVAALVVLVAAVVAAIVVKRKPESQGATAANLPVSAVAEEPELPDQKPIAARRPEASRVVPRANRPAARAEATAPAESQSDDARVKAAELAAAMQRVPIRMYTTSWCPVCNKAKAYMLDKRISYVAIDVEGSPDAKRAHRAINPQGSIPTFDIDGEVLVGFGPDQIQAAIRRSAERSLRR